MSTTTGDNHLKPEEPRYVCHACIGDKILAKQVENEGAQAGCNYCHSTNAALTLGDLSNRIHQVLEEHFKPIYLPPESPDDMYRPEDYFPEGLENSLEDIENVIVKVTGVGQGITEDVRRCLFDRVVRTVNIEEGKENPYKSGTLYHEPKTDPTDFRLAWKDFRNEIRSRARFFGTTTETNLDEIFRGLSSLRTIEGESVIREIRPGDNDSFVWRARTVHSQAELKSVLESPIKELGPPPSDKAKSGRMNAEGIPVFYGALEESTCVSEIRPPVGSRVVLGKFDVLNPIQILDLGALSEIYLDISYFDPHYSEERSRERFLGELVEELSRPVIPNEEALEYLPTQIVSEYLANKVEPRLHGMLFPSSQTGGTGRNLVLFAEAYNVEPHEYPSGTSLRVELLRNRRVDPEDGHGEYLVIETQSSDLATSRQSERVGSQTGGVEYYEQRVKRNDNAPTLRLNMTSLKVLNVKSAKYEWGDTPVHLVTHLSMTARAGGPTARFSLSVKNPDLESPGPAPSTPT